MSAQVCDGHIETGEACDGRCDPHRAEVLRRMKNQSEIFSLAYDLAQSGAITEEQALTLYRLGEHEWDDALHFPSPHDGHITLCGLRGRNIIPIDASRDAGGDRCWTCLHTRDRLVANAPAVVSAVGSAEHNPAGRGHGGRA